MDLYKAKYSDKKLDKHSKSSKISNRNFRDDEPSRSFRNSKEKRSPRERYSRDERSPRERYSRDERSPRERYSRDERSPDRKSTRLNSSHT